MLLGSPFVLWSGDTDEANFCCHGGRLLHRPLFARPVQFPVRWKRRRTAGPDNNPAPDWVRRLKTYGWSTRAQGHWVGGAALVARATAWPTAPPHVPQNRLTARARRRTKAGQRSPNLTPPCSLRHSTPTL